MKNNADLPAFPKATPDGDAPQWGITKREYFAAQIAGHLITREKYPASFLDFMKHQLNKIGYNFDVNYRLDIDARCTAQQVAIHTDTLLDQLESNRLDNLGDGSRLRKCADGKERPYRDKKS